MVVKPIQARPGVFDRGRIWILRRKPVVERKHNALRPARERAAHRVVSVEIAVNPAAAVHIKERGQGAIRRRRVEPERDLAVGPWEASVLDERDGLFDCGVHEGRW